jgi:hypothetical protein
MFLVSTLFCIPYWLKFRYTRELGLHETELGQNPLFNRIVHFWMYLPIAYFIPLTILIFTNLYLIGTIMLARRRRQRLGMSNSTHSSGSVQNNNLQQQQALLGTSGLKKEEITPARGGISAPQRQARVNSCAPTTMGANVTRSGSNGVGGMSVTIMLIAVVFLFFACQFPVLVLHIIQSMFCTDSESDRFRCKTSMLYLYAQIIAKFLLICNLSLNFACYCLFSRQFRLVLRETLLISCYRVPPDVTSSPLPHNVRTVNGEPPVAVAVHPPSPPAV